MANWKKVIVSGSNADLNHITASGNISASGNLFGNLPTGTEDKVIIYDSATGQLKFKVLNLVSTVAAPGLFLADIPLESNTEFKLGFDRGSDTQPITAPFELSASYTLDGSVTTKTSDNDNNININGSWTDVDINQLTGGYYTAGGTGVNVTSSITDRRNGLLTNGTDSAYTKQSITLHLQSILNTNQAVPGYDLTQANLNYGNRGINDGGIGELRVYVNNNLVNSPKRSIALDPSNNPPITDTVSNITANLFASQSNKNAVGEVDITKHYRSGSITIGTTHQVDGYNYAYILHTGSKDGTDFARITNFQEWFYDIDGHDEAMAATAVSSTNPDLSSAPIGYLSGIKYLKGGTGTYTRSSTCTNQYRNIYNNGGGLKLSCDNDLVTKISVTQSGDHLATNPTENDATSPSSTQTFNLAPLADTDESYLGTTTLEANYDIDLGYGTSFHAPSDFIDTPFGEHESAYNIGTSNTEFENPNKADKTATFSDINDFLLNRLVSSSTTETRYEQFRGEEYRIKDGTYTFNSFTPSSYAWDSEKNIINGGTGFNGGLIQYYSHLVYPTKAGTAGNFNPAIAPTSNADYSSATGTRTYYRYFKCDSGGFKQFQLEFKGSGKIVKSNNSLTTDSDEIHVFVQRLGDNSTTVTNSSLTTLIDAMDDSVRDGALFFDDAHHIPVVTSGISYSQDTSVGPGGQDNINVRNSVVAVAEGASANLGIINNEHVLVKIVVPQGWTGYLDAMAIRYGNLPTPPTPLLNSLSPS